MKQLVTLLAILTLTTVHSSFGMKRKATSSPEGEPSAQRVRKVTAATAVTSTAASDTEMKDRKDGKDSKDSKEVKAAGAVIIIDQTVHHPARKLLTQLIEEYSAADKQTRDNFPQKVKALLTQQPGIVNQLRPYLLDIFPDNDNYRKDDVDDLIYEEYGDISFKYASLFLDRPNHRFHCLDSVALPAHIKKWVAIDPNSYIFYGHSNDTLHLQLYQTNGTRQLSKLNECTLPLKGELIDDRLQVCGDDLIMCTYDKAKDITCLHSVKHFIKSSSSKQPTIMQEGIFNNGETCLWPLNVAIDRNSRQLCLLMAESWDEEGPLTVMIVKKQIDGTYTLAHQLPLKFTDKMSEFNTSVRWRNSTTLDLFVSHNASDDKESVSRKLTIQTAPTANGEQLICTENFPLKQSLEGALGWCPGMTPEGHPLTQSDSWFNVLVPHPRSGQLEAIFCVKKYTAMKTPHERLMATIIAWARHDKAQDEQTLLNSLEESKEQASSSSSSSSSATGTTSQLRLSGPSGSASYDGQAAVTAAATTYSAQGSFVGQAGSNSSSSSSSSSATSVNQQGS